MMGINVELFKPIPVKATRHNSFWTIEMTFIDDSGRAILFVEDVDEFLRLLKKAIDSEKRRVE